MNWLIFIAASLACFRITRLITDDKIMAWLRRDISKAGKKAKEGIACSFCVSFYIAVAFVILITVAGYVPYSELLLWQPAIWGASILWNQVFCFLTRKA